MKTKNILVPIDFTNVAETGLANAVDLAYQFNANINLLHIIPLHESTGFPTTGDTEALAKEDSERKHFIMELIKKRKKQMQQIIERQKSKGIQFYSFVEYGSFEKQLRNHLETYPTDLIVMGTTGETSVSEYLTGNHAAKAIRVADVPVLAIKDYYPILLKDNLLILVDLKDYDLQKVKLIKKFADLLQLKVIIGHVKQFKDLVKGDIYYELQKFAFENKFQDSKIHVIGKEEKIKAVKDFVRAHNINIIASISEGDTGLTRFFFGSDTEDFISEIDRPLIAVSR